jgi:hypothetical protein
MIVWKAGHLTAYYKSQLRRLKELEIENARLKKMYADLSLAHEAFKLGCRKLSCQDSILFSNS